MSVALTKEMRLYANRVQDMVTHMQEIHEKYPSVVEFRQASKGEQRKYVHTFIEVVTMCDEGLPTSIQKYFRRPWYKGVKTLVDKVSWNDSDTLYEPVYMTCSNVLSKMAEVFQEVSTWPDK